MSAARNIKSAAGLAAEKQFPPPLGAFDWPAEAHSQGSVTGALYARELLLSLREKLEDPAASRTSLTILVRETLHDAAIRMRYERGRPSASAAAGAFLNAMAELICFCAQHADVEKYTACRLQEAQRWNAILAKRRQEFVQRMSAAKARKRLSGHGAQA